MNGGGPTIHLDVSVPNFSAGSHDLPADAGSRQAAPDAQDQERFRQALESAKADASPEPPAGAPGLAVRVMPPARPLDPAQERLRQELGRHIGQMVERLRVGQGRSGGARVQMALASDILPGVSVAIERIEGRLEVEFTCSHEDSRRTLVDALEQVSQALAQRLREPVRVVVQTDDEEDRCRVERLAAAEVGGEEAAGEAGEGRRAPGKAGADDAAA